MNQSSSTFLSFSSRSSKSGRHSSICNDDWARARDASLPANTVVISRGHISHQSNLRPDTCRQGFKEIIKEHTVIRAFWRVRLVCRHIEDCTFDCYIRRICLISPYITSLISDTPTQWSIVVRDTIPSHLASASTLIRSSLGGLSWGGDFGAKLLVVSRADIGDSVTDRSETGDCNLATTVQECVFCSDAYRTNMVEQ